MADVARLAGVSAMTVSRALRSGSPVSPSTRRRILEVVENIGYVPDGAAGALSSRRSGFVAVLIPSIVQSGFAETARGLSDTLASQHLQMLLGYTDHNPDREEKAVETMLRRRPEAIVVTGEPHTARTRRHLENARIPVVEMWGIPAQPIDSVVGLSFEAAASSLVRTLADKGYKNIGFVGSAAERDPRGDDLYRGYCKALQILHLGGPRSVRQGGPEMGPEHGARGVVQLLAQYPEADALVCSSDVVAYGAVMECKRRGWNVPERIAVAGFGDHEIGRFCSPSLTTIAVNCYGVGVEVGKLVLSNLDSVRRRHSPAPSTVHMDFHVVERAST
jgi:LacI family gluconate utilization system Gnt-I transcriptional repressor